MLAYEFRVGTAPFFSSAAVLLAAALLAEADEKLWKGWVNKFANKCMFIVCRNFNVIACLLEDNEKIG